MPGPKLFNLEPLEHRQLLAGVTILMHGHQGSINGWVTAAADAIASRIGSSQTSQFVMKVAKSGGKLAVTSFVQSKGPAMSKSSTGEAIIKLDWTAVDDGSYSTDEVGNVVSGFLMRPNSLTPPLVELPLHLIGHSRGASLAVAISEDLGKAGIWVDQETFLDPHPVEDYFGLPVGYGDVPMKVYNNVIFADNYWRDDGNLFNIDPDGQHVSGAHEGDLNNIVQKHFVISAHMAVTSYYHGTIDLKASNNRDHPIFSDWYGTTESKPARSETGYVFSRLGGGSRPVDGLIGAFGGTGSRSDVGKNGDQWANGANLRFVGGTRFPVGEKLKLRFIRQNRDQPVNVTIGMDRDSNPYNTNAVRTMRRAVLEESDKMALTGLSAFTGGVDPGRYFIYAQFTDALGRTRYTYSRRITLTAPSATVPLAAGGVVTKTNRFSSTAQPIAALSVADQIL